MLCLTLSFLCNVCACSPNFNFSSICISTNLNYFSASLSQTVINCEVINIVGFVVKYHVLSLVRVQIKFVNEEPLFNFA